MPENKFEHPKIMLLGQLSGKLWQKGKMAIFGVFFFQKKIEGGKKVEFFGPKKNHLCRKLYPQHESDTYIMHNNNTNQI